MHSPKRFGQFEHRREPLLPFPQFLRRLSRHGAVAFVLVTSSLAIGMAGYHGLEGQPWVDAFLNAAMLLGGMGPVGELHTTAGKLFAGAYALYAGLVFLVAAGIVFAPVLHRLFHRFHLEQPDSRE